MKTPVDWPSLDYSLPSTVLARQVNRSVGRVSRGRRRYAPDTLYVIRKPGSGPRPACDWSAVDWSLSNEVIAKSHKVTPACVSKHRRTHAPQTSSDRHSHPRADWPNVDWTRPDWSLEAEYGVTVVTVRLNRKRYAH